MPTAHPEDPAAHLKRLRQAMANPSRSISPADSAAPVELAARRAVFQLPPPLHSKLALEQVLHERRATREFGNEPVPLAAAGTILRAAHWRDRHAYDDKTFDDAVDILLLASRVADLPAALYQYNPQSHAVSKIGTAPSRAEARTMVRQEEFASAAAVLLVMGKPSAIIERLGIHGYRRLLVYGGFAAHQAWLCTVSLQLVACLFEGLFPRALERLAAERISSWTTILACAIGTPLRSRLDGIDADPEP